MIIWLASYPKSGNTWLRAFLGCWLANEQVHVNNMPDWGLGGGDTRRDLYEEAAGTKLISADAIPEKSFEGKIKRISPVVDPTSGTIKVTIDLSESRSELVPGLFIRVKIVLDTHDLALIIPKRALLKEEERAYVFVAKDGVVAKTELATGFSDSERLEVLGGLALGDLVVVDGQSRLGDGMSVRIIEGLPASAG